MDQADTAEVRVVGGRSLFLFMFCAGAKIQKVSQAGLWNNHIYEQDPIQILFHCVSSIEASRKEY